MEPYRPIWHSCVTQCIYWTDRSKYLNNPDSRELDIILIAKLSRQVKDVVDCHVSIPFTRSSNDIASAMITAIQAYTAELISWTALEMYCQLEKLPKPELKTTKVSGLMTIAVENKARSAATAEKAIAKLQKEGAPVMATVGRRLVGPDDVEEMAKLWQEIVPWTASRWPTVEEKKRCEEELRKTEPEYGIYIRPTRVYMQLFQLIKLDIWLKSTATLPQILLNLPVVPLHRQNRKGKKKYREKMGDNCGICLETFYNEGMGVAAAVVSLPVCGHWFHKECAMEWLHCQNTCPMCRRRFLKVEECEEWACKVDKRRARRKRRRGLDK
ncbi:hypothetical protein QBC40DRAFT_329324 [Triangularia verruculosa]|uniref:RING-type domain-containing protein n=1 Tax=Triangularia verruculosa TaxID=2587418 RepID=A0AAN6XQ68_9PEZI|nr:hypothetical protein QBC40DRAFT_329324 [Triangularia verruculosa]